MRDDLNIVAGRIDLGRIYRYWVYSREVDIVVNVLWLDDEPSSLRREALLAEQHGWNITWGETVSRGLQLVQDRAFGLIVVDLILPMTDYEQSRGFSDADAGLHFIELIRERTRLGRTPPDVPILVITAVASEKLKQRVLNKLESGRYFLEKPLDDEAYGEIVRELTQRLAPSA